MNAKGLFYFENAKEKSCRGVDCIDKFVLHVLKSFQHCCNGIEKDPTEFFILHTSNHGRTLLFSKHDIIQNDFLFKITILWVLPSTSLEMRWVLLCLLPARMFDKKRKPDWNIDQVMKVFFKSSNFQCWKFHSSFGPQNYCHCFQLAILNSLQPILWNHTSVQTLIRQKHQLIRYN